MPLEAVQVAEMIQAALDQHEAKIAQQFREQVRVLVREELDRIARGLEDRRHPRGR
jgi:hypothetical protein